MHLIHITFDARELKTCPQVIIPNKTKEKLIIKTILNFFPAYLTIQLYMLNKRLMCSCEIPNNTLKKL